MTHGSGAREERKVDRQRHWVYPTVVISSSAILCELRDRVTAAAAAAWMAVTAPALFHTKQRLHSLRSKCCIIASMMVQPPWLT